LDSPARSGIRRLITPFEVPPDADVSFVAAWDRDVRAAVLYRALRPDVDFRFVEIADVEAPPAGDDASAYAVAREDGRPDVEGGVVLIEPFEVGDGEDERFLASWDRAREVLVRQRGSLGTRLHRSLAAAGFRFVDVARWSSPLMVARAMAQPDVRQAVDAIGFRSHPAIYQPIRKHH
jgi:hypothetical protein